MPSKHYREEEELHYPLQPLSERLAQACVLIVDDSDFNLKLITSVMTRAGFCNVHTATDGVIALEKTHLLDPAIVILDLAMPNLDGYGYLEQIRKQLPQPRVPVIVQTILHEREAKLRALACGADDFLNKPLDPDELPLRACAHLERYFMLQDLNEIRHYLEMELELAQVLIEGMNKSSLANPAAANLVTKQHEILQQLASIPSLKAAQKPSAN